MLYTDPWEQLHQVLSALQLYDRIRQFIRCRRCNGALQSADRQEVEAELPPGIAEQYHVFKRPVMQLPVADYIDASRHGYFYTDTAVRIVDPLHLVGHRGEWYLLCWAHHHQEVRIYALFRIKQATLCKETFTRPEGFCPEDYIDPSFGVFVNEDSAELAIRFSGEAASKISERRWHPDQTIERLENGDIILRFRTNQQSQVLFWVSQWGPNAEILQPPELRRRAKEWFEAAAARYGP